LHNSSDLSHVFSQLQKSIALRLSATLTAPNQTHLQNPHPNRYSCLFNNNATNPRAQNHILTSLGGSGIVKIILPNSTYPINAMESIVQV
jgi:hypothetical protein